MRSIGRCLLATSFALLLLSTTSSLASAQVPPADPAEVQRITALRDEAAQLLETELPQANGPSSLAVGTGLAALALGLVLIFFLLRGRRARLLLQQQAHADPLTGLANRRRLNERLDEMTVAAVDDAVAVAMVDVDHFKLVNDRFGHEAGDTLLRTVARVIERSVRPDDVVYRYGGEEFCVLLPGSSMAEAEAVAQRIRLAVEGLVLHDISHDLSVSVGVSSGQKRQASATLRRADDALLSAKQLGRNLVVTAS